MLDTLIQYLLRGEEPAPLLTPLREGVSPFAAFGVCGGLPALLAAAAAQALSRPLLVVVPDIATMRHTQTQLAALGLPNRHLPPRPLQLHPLCADSTEVAHQRIAALDALLRGQTVVAPIDALLCAQSPPEVFAAQQLDLEAGQTHDPTALAARLLQWGYERVGQVQAPGQFALRGDILDVYPPVGTPFRAELFGEELDSLRALEVNTQRSRLPLPRVHLLGCLETPLSAAARKRGNAAIRHAATKQRDVDYAAALENLAGEDIAARSQNLAGFLPLYYPQRHTILEYLPSPFLCALLYPDRIRQKAMQQAEEFEQHCAVLSASHRMLPQQRAALLPYEAFSDALGAADAQVLCMQSLPTADRVFPPKGIWRLDCRPYPSGETDEQRLDTLADLRQKGHAVCLCAGDKERAARLVTRLGEDGIGALPSLTPGQLCVSTQSYAEGFVWPQAHLSVAGTRELYGSHAKATGRARSGNKSLFLEFSPGDYVVHDSHGIGVYMGLESMEAAGQRRDYLLIRYAGADRLYVPTDQMHRVQRYVGKGAEGVKLNRLSGGEWNRTRAKVQRSVAALAFDLTALYAQREQAKGYAFSPDTVWQREFEDAFPYRETEDQLRCIQEIKADMERPRPMDRLLCGDVGYGKTEVAMRAAFKAAMDGKQTAILAPTTVLVQQHAQTLERRMEGFPVSVGALSRLVQGAQQKSLLRRLEEGRVDILVGTHRLLGKDVAFHDLGLLIIDEEQRFGVAHKERIKTLKQSIDVLTLSATPIPRTLHMSMIGVRDVSILSTPPEHRLPVQTYVLEYSDTLVLDAVLRELRRGGQVYFVYNNVQGIDAFAASLHELLPNLAIGIAHGQMPARALESVMLDFYRHKLDLLLCSTIIESGLDVPNVNTLIVYDADNFGLAQLYQLRGRVGRSDRGAYAYFTFRRQKVLSEVAQKRLDALCEFTGFGAGFKVAMRDLEIRGAGDILGAQQHGHMMEVGYDLYCRMLEEALSKAAAGESGEPDAPQPVQTQLTVNLPAYIPRSYIQDEEQRIEVYKRMAVLKTPKEAKRLAAELLDRFGKPPAAVGQLLQLSWLRQACCVLGVARLEIKEGVATFAFAPGVALRPDALLQLVGEYPHTAFLQPGTATTIALRKKTRDTAGMLALAGEFAQGLQTCV